MGNHWPLSKRAVVVSGAFGGLFCLLLKESRFLLDTDFFFFITKGVQVSLGTFGFSQFPVFKFNVGDS